MPDGQGYGATAGASTASTPKATRVGDIDNSVAIPTARYEELAAKRALPRALMGGTKAMREAGEKFLPRHPDEAQASYDMRLKSTTLYNGFKETVTAQSAKFFAEPIVLKDDVPPRIKELADNIDQQRRAITPFCHDLAREAFIDGVSFIFVDMPKLPPGATLYDQQQAKARPYWVLVCADALIGWRSDPTTGDLLQARIRENVVLPDGAFGERIVKRVRVLEPGAWTVWELRKVENRTEEVWVCIEEGAASLKRIALFPFYTNRVGYMEGEPPLMALAELNREHWHSSSEQRRALSFLRFAMLKITGVMGGPTGDKKISIAPDKILTLPVGADAAYVEHSGAGIAAGQADIDAIETRMASAGMQLRVDQSSGNVSATEAAIDSAETNAGLRAVAKGLTDTIALALQADADFLGLPNGGSVDLFDDFANAQIPGTVSELQGLVTAKIVSRPTIWKELKRRHVLDEEFDDKQEQTLLDEESAKDFQSQVEMFQATQPEPAAPAAGGGA